MRLVVVLVGLVSVQVFASRQDTLELKPKPFYGREARTIADVLTSNHYRKIILNDSMSSVIFDRYLQELDNNRSYFLDSDIKLFEKYRYSIDDLIKDEDVSSAYKIYTVFRKRYFERMNYVLSILINQEHDYTIDEFYETDREKEPWAKTTDELNEIWRKIIKSQALSLKLAGKNQEEIKESLKKRFERFDKYMAQLNSEDVFSIYMNAITESYDPHTNYFSPKASELFKQSMSLSLEGIGAQLQTDNDYTKVVHIIPGGPADKSGLLHSNDYIVGVAQGKDEVVDVIGWRIDDVVKLIKGPKGTVVRLQIIPSTNGIGGASHEIVLTRDKVKLEDQAAKKSIYTFQVGGKEQKLGVISLPSFYLDYEAYQRGDTDYKSTTRDVKKLISELKLSGVAGIVMDLRNNGGGSLPEAIDLTGLFIKDGPVVQIKSSNNRIDVLPDNDNGVFYAGPLVVLTNRFSASASEIFAGAIQDYKRGVIVGETTFGKGTVQSIIDLNKLMREKEPIGSLKITFQKFYRVTGSSTQHKGITPDVLMPSALDASEFGESANLSALPWDVIKSVAFQPATDVNDKLITKLNKSYHEREKSDARLKKYIQNTAELKKNISENKISLNETVRKKEMEEAEKRKAQEKLDTKITNTKEGVPATIDLEKIDDEVLREGLLILSETLNKRNG